MGKEARPTVIAGNWKMNKTIAEAVSFIESVAPLVKDASAKVWLAVPFTALSAASKAAQGSNLVIGAQNLSEMEEGAYTGEISGRMLKEAGAAFVIVGHSERRTLFHETNQIVNKKLHRALQCGLNPILCVGETAEERKAGHTETVLKNHLLKSLHGLATEQIQKTVIAYEPIWAIGTGNVATPEIAEEVHSFCRSVISHEWGKEVAEKIVIQYGGSVKPENAKMMLDQSDIDGLLIGGASLTYESFSKIVNLHNAKVRI